METNSINHTETYVDRSPSAISANSAIVSAALMMDKLQIDGQLLETTVATASSSVTLGASTTTSLGSSVGKLPDWFNEDVPQAIIEAFCIPGKDVFSKLYLMIDWMRANPANTHAPEVFLNFVSKLCADPKKYAEILTILTNKSLSYSTTSIFQNILDVLVKEQYVINHGDPAKLNSYLDELARKFSGHDSISNDINEKIKDLREIVNMPANLSPWKKYNQYFDHPEAFSVVASGLWGSAIRNIDVLEWMRVVRLQEFDDILKEFKNNPLLALMILICLLNDASTATSIGGFGATSKYMDDRTQDVSEIIKTWQNGFASEEDAKKFISKIKEFLHEIDNNPLASQISKMIDTEFQTILDLKYDGKTLDELFIADMNDPASHKLLVALQAFQKKPDPKPTDITPPTFPPEYQTILSELRSSTSSISAFSQTLSTALTQLTNQDQVTNNTLNKFLTSVNDLISYANRHQIPG